MKNNIIKFRAFGYINKNADRIENYDCLINPLAERGYEVDLNNERNELLTLSLEQKGEQAELTMKVNSDQLTFAAVCNADLPSQEKYNIVVNGNIDQIIAAVENRML
jgi:hypothetical protein